MISGQFNQKGELVFEIELITAAKNPIQVKALFDTGFNHWLLINNKDAQSLGWLPKMTSRRVRTAAGITLFNLYEGIVVLDDEEFTIPVLGGDKITEILLGVRWLQFRRLIADFSADFLTLD